MKLRCNLDLLHIDVMEIEYSSLRMAEYLLPNKSLSILGQRYFILITNRMIKMENRQIEDMKHIHSCKIYDTENENEGENFEKIFENDVRKIKKIYEKFKKISEKREQTENTKSPRILNVDPLYHTCTAMEIN